MNFIETIKLAINSLTANRLRSFLTMLGIIIGITAVITITTIGNSISSLLSSEFSKFGTNIVTVSEDEIGNDDDIIDNSEFPYMIGNSTGVTGFFKESSIRLGR